MRTNIKIWSVFMLLILTGLTLYLSFSLEDKENNIVSFVELNGNIHLPKDEYLKFAGLNTLEKNSLVDIAIIRDRLSKHPYVDVADVIIEESSLIIDIKEKRFEALVTNGNKQFLISENSIAIPFLPFTQKINYPLISNPRMEKNIKSLTSIKLYADVVCALKIISSLKLVNTDMFDQLSEVNLRNGGDILVHFSNVNFPIIIGRGSEVRKILTFNQLWNHLSGKQVNDVINYVDLRYSDHIFLGFPDNPESDRGSRI